MGVENLATTGIQSPDHPAHSKSLYRLSYPDPQWFCITIIIIKIQENTKNKLEFKQLVYRYQYHKKHYCFKVSNPISCINMKKFVAMDYGNNLEKPA
jgi:hypothetical protein